MKNEEHQLLAYDFSFGGGENNSYFFETINNIFYQVKFKPTTYLFGEESIFAPLTYELVIELIDDTIKLPLDKLIPYTIASIFEDFFNKNAYNIVVYLYESSDSRQDARKRKFDSWFGYFKQRKYDRFEVMLSDLEGQLYFTTMIIRRDNPNRKQIATNFIEVMADHNK
jgi:hypothetical protein